MSMHMIRGVRAPGSGKKKPKVKSASVLAAEKALRDTLNRVGYKGTASKHRGSLDTNYLKVDRSQKTSDVIPSNGNKKEDKIYTGTEIGGIAVMHKSNMVPIRKDNKEGFIDVAQMRRN